LCVPVAVPQTERLADPPGEHRSTQPPAPASSVAAGDTVLTNTPTQRDRLIAATGDLSAARDERDALDRRESQLQRQVRELRDGLAEQQVLEPPGWARETFGERLAHQRTAEQWDRGVRAIARYRIDHDLHPTRPQASGPNPKTAAHATRGAKSTTPSSRSSGAWDAASTATAAMTAARALNFEI